MRQSPAKGLINTSEVYIGSSSTTYDYLLAIEINYSKVLALFYLECKAMSSLDDVSLRSGLLVAGMMQRGCWGIAEVREYHD